MARFDVTDPSGVLQLKREHPLNESPPPSEAQSPEPQPDGLIAEVEACLRANDVRGARTLVAEAGAEGAGTALPVVELAKARIAAATGDHPAARAILVMALEKVPSDQKLRAFLTETMMAAGRATDIRSVLGHIG